LHARTVVDQHKLGGCIIELDAPGHGTQQPTAERSQCSPHVARAFFAECDAGIQRKVGRHHLAFAEVAVVAQFTALLQRALLLHVLHGRAALHHHKAVGLLNQHAQLRHGGPKLVALHRSEPGGLLVFNHRDGAHALGAFF
jgi:hypothetical protein